jgi:GntR family transcriptional repressor for pyruvate dehydrogenase complex
VAARQAKVRIFERVRDAVLDDIRSGKLVPGDRLPSERALAEKFAVGRHAVREALRTLEMSGVLRFAKGVSGGAFVREKSGHGVSQSIRDMIVVGRMPLIDLMVVRVNLLVQAAELAADRGADSDFAAIEANIAETRDAIVGGDPALAIEPLVEFNRLLGQASHNLVLSMLIDSVADIMHDVLVAFLLPIEIDVITPRWEILAALRAGDARRAGELIRSHYDVTTAYVLTRARQSGVADHA